MLGGPLEDHVLIRERYSLYSDAVFQKSREAWLSCWCGDGIWQIFGKEIRGKEELRKQWEETWQPIDCMAFFCEIGMLEVNGDRAEVRSYCHEIVSFKNGKLLKVVAQYKDELVKQQGTWLFSRREYTVLIKD